MAYGLDEYGSGFFTLTKSVTGILPAVEHLSAERAADTPLGTGLKQRLRQCGCDKGRLGSVSNARALMVED